jgi:hypothetical protein
MAAAPKAATSLDALRKASADADKAAADAYEAHAQASGQAELARAALADAEAAEPAAE